MTDFIYPAYTRIYPRLNPVICKENRRFHFTEATVRDLPLPAKGARTCYYDTEMPALELRVTGAGSKVFYVYKWFTGAARPVRVKLDPWPGLKVAKARRLAADELYKLAKGIDPNQSKRAARGEINFGALFNLVYESFYKVHRPRSAYEYKRFYENHLSHWQAKRLSEIDRAEVQKLKARIAEKVGKYAANKGVRLLSSIFNKAKDYGFDKPNPAEGIEKFKEESRERFLAPHELPAFFDALSKEKPDSRDLFMVLLLTGARKSNVFSMRWQDLNLKDGVWNIPETKTGPNQRVALSSEAVRILENRQARIKTDYVFPAGTESGHVADVKRAWKRILENAGLEKLRIHDLRRSLGSWQAATGANLSIISKSLGHRNIATTMVYARLNIDPIKESVERASKAILKAGGLMPDAEIIDIAEARRRKGESA